MYYSFTTLTSVGLGDFVPRSEGERLWAIIIFGIGVFMFYLYQSEFHLILHQYSMLVNDIDHLEELNVFTGVLQHYNKGKRIDHELKVKLE